MAKQIQIEARKWFDRRYGNTYFSAVLFVDGEQVGTVGPEYGYGEHYVDRGMDELERLGHVPPRKRYSSGGKTAPWRHAEACGFELSHACQDVKRERELDSFVEEGPNDAA